MGRRLHAAALVPGERVLCGEDHHYLFRVLRLRPGAALTLFDGEGREADAEVVSIGAEAATVRVGGVRDVPVAARPRVSVLLALIKGERLEWCVQKLVELGVDEVVPWRAARSVVKLDAARAASRHQRLLATARAAAAQCRSATVPEIGQVVDLDEALGRVPAAALKLLLWERAAAASVRDALAAPAPAAVALLVGPEGGLDRGEVERAVDAGFQAVGLGPRILRAETAAIAGLTAVRLAFGDLG